MPEAPCPALAAMMPTAGVKCGLPDGKSMSGKQDQCLYFWTYSPGAGGNCCMCFPNNWTVIYFSKDCGCFSCVHGTIILTAPCCIPCCSPQCYVDCPGMAAQMPTAGIKSGPPDGKGNSGKQDQCLCRSCCCGQQPKVIPCYKQPKVPESYAPKRCYRRPAAPLECCTTYKLSYLPVNDCSNLRGDVVKPVANIVPSLEPMEGYSVQKLSYLPNPVCVTHACRPCNHDMWGQGPMQCVTTNRHDYVPKPCQMRESYKPAPKFHAVDEPFEDKTVNKLSFLPPTKLEPTRSFAPERCYAKPTAKMDGCTTHKLSYIPNPVMPKEPLPWACKGQYQPPCQKLDSGTTYNLSYLDAQSDCRRQPIMPIPGSNPVTAYKDFDGLTVYKGSYIPASVPIPAPVKPANNIVTSTAQMEGETVHKLSFLPNPVCMTQAIRPCNHDMWGQGPMQCVTTQRHDFVPKPTQMRESYKPSPKFHAVDEPFENKTTNRLSYLNPGRQATRTSFAPTRHYERPAAKMDGCTTQKLSYQPVCAPSPQRPPWACKGQYQPPCQRFEATTVYNASYLPPGEDCSTVIDPCAYGDCKPCDCVCPSECIKQDPCACAFPRAEC